MENELNTLKVEADDAVIVIRPDGTADVRMNPQAGWTKGHWLTAGLCMLINDRPYVDRLIAATITKLDQAKGK